MIKYNGLISFRVKDKKMMQQLIDLAIGDPELHIVSIDEWHTRDEQPDIKDS